VQSETGRGVRMSPALCLSLTDAVVWGGGVTLFSPPPEQSPQPRTRIQENVGHYHPQPFHPVELILLFIPLYWHYEKQGGTVSSGI